MAAIFFDWIFVAIVWPWPLLAIYELVKPSGSGVVEPPENVRPGVGAVRR